MSLGRVSLTSFLALVDLPSDLSQLVNMLNELAEAVRQDYDRINRVVEEFIENQEQS